MIGVDRSKVDPPTCLDLDDEDSAASKERTKAIDHFTDPAAGSFDFAVYRYAEIKQAFEKLFHGKCAYCESRYASTQPVDVEHFRPKGMVKLTPDAISDGQPREKPGYFWLAASWENLLPSCIDCNRNRKQPVLIRQDGSLEPRETTAMAGKANFFPLQNEDDRCDDPSSDYSGEKPLLLNPCDDGQEAAKILRFTSDGAVMPSEKIDEIQMRKFHASSQIYGLNRMGLVHDRQEILLQLRERQYVIRELSKLINHHDWKEDDEKLTIIQDLLTHEMEAMRRFSKPERPYSLMARQFIESFLQELTGEELFVDSL